MDGLKTKQFIEEIISKTLSNKDKISIFMNLIGDECAIQILKNLSHFEVKKIASILEQPQDIQSEDEKAVADEFFQNLSFILLNQEAEEFERNYKNNKTSASHLVKQMDASDEEVSIWDKLLAVKENILVDYFQKEHPQAVAVIMSCLKPEQAARVLTLLPEEMSNDIIERMLKLDDVKPEVIVDIEKALQAELVQSADSAKKDVHLKIAEIFNRLERGTDAKYLSFIENIDQTAAAKIRHLMFTFDDLKKLKDEDIRVLLKFVDRSKLSVALKGTTDEFKNIFIRNMPERAAKLLKEAISDLGGLKLREVEEAQAAIVSQVKELAGQGDISLSQDEQTDEVVY